MRRWRVGTISLGILLIALGVIILASQVRQVLILKTLLQWWPLILAVLGLEILVYLYTAKEPEPKVKYDTFSMFLIFVVVLGSIGAYAITATGIMERIYWTVTSNIMTVELPAQNVKVDENVKKIVVSAPRGSFTVRKNSTQAFTSFGQATVNVVGDEEIDFLLRQCQPITYQAGDTLFVQFLSVPWQGDTKPGIREIHRTLLVPPQAEVEINGSQLNLELDCQAVQQDWFIKGNGLIDITLAASADLAVEAQVRDLSQLSGNAAWEVEETSASATNDDVYYLGRMKWGDGQNKLKIILSSGQISLNVI